MPKPRTNSSANVPASRKRSLPEDTQPMTTSPAKRRADPPTAQDSVSGQAQLDADRDAVRNVHFPMKRSLVQGPTPANRRAGSPPKSSLRQPSVSRVENLDGAEDVDVDEMSEPSSASSATSYPAIFDESDSHRNSSTTTAPSSAGSDGAMSFEAVKGRQGSDVHLPDPESLANDEDRDEVVCRELDGIKKAIHVLTQKLPDSRTAHHGSVLDALLVIQHAETVRYIGCLALGGPKGEYSWQELIADHACRQSLAYGIVGRALKESVFSELWFGATEAQQTALSNMEKDQAEHDGFYRTSQRRSAIEGYLESEDDTKAGQRALTKAKVKLSLQLEQLLVPLWKLGGRTDPMLPNECRSDILKIVTAAANLSRWMRRVPNTVYYWPPTFKDEEFEPARMECVNVKDMITSSPYSKKHMQGRDRAELIKGQEAKSEAIVRIVCFPGLVAYRQGGGALAKRLLQEEGSKASHAPPDVQAQQRRARKGEALDGTEGFRTKVVCKSVIHLQWGKQRLLSKEAGTAAYLDATRDGSKKYEKDDEGFKELFDIFRAKNAKLLKK